MYTVVINYPSDVLYEAIILDARLVELSVVYHDFVNL